MQAVVASTYGSKANALKVLKKQFPVADDKVVAELAQKLTADAKTTDEKCTDWKLISVAWVLVVCHCFKQGIVCVPHRK